MNTRLFTFFFLFLIFSVILGFFQPVQAQAQQETEQNVNDAFIFEGYENETPVYVCNCNIFFPREIKLSKSIPGSFEYYGENKSNVQYFLSGLHIPFFDLQNLNHYWFAKFISSVTVDYFVIKLNVSKYEFFLPNYRTDLNNKIIKDLYIIISEKNVEKNNFLRLHYNITIVGNEVNLYVCNLREKFRLEKGREYYIYVFYTLNIHESYHIILKFKDHVHYYHYSPDRFFVDEKFVKGFDVQGEYYIQSNEYSILNFNFTKNYLNYNYLNYKLSFHGVVVNNTYIIFATAIRNKDYVFSYYLTIEYHSTRQRLRIKNIVTYFESGGLQVYENVHYVYENIYFYRIESEGIVSFENNYARVNSLVKIVTSNNYEFPFYFSRYVGTFYLSVKSGVFFVQNDHHFSQVKLNFDFVRYNLTNLNIIEELNLNKVEYPTVYRIYGVIWYSNVFNNTLILNIKKVSDREFTFSVTHCLIVRDETEREYSIHIPLPFNSLSLSLYNYTRKLEDIRFSLDFYNFTFILRHEFETTRWGQYFIHYEILDLPLPYQIINNLKINVNGDWVGWFPGTMLHMRSINDNLILDELTPPYPLRIIPAQAFKTFSIKKEIFLGHTFLENHIFVPYVIHELEVKENTIRISTKPTLAFIFSDSFQQLIDLNTYILIYDANTQSLLRVIKLNVHNFDYERIFNPEKNKTEYKINFRSVETTLQLKQDLSYYIIVVSTTLSQKLLQTYSKYLLNYFLSNSLYTLVMYKSQDFLPFVGPVSYAILLISLLVILAVFNSLNMMSAAVVFVALTFLFSTLNIIPFALLFVVLGIVGMIALILAMLRYTSGGAQE